MIKLFINGYGNIGRRLASAFNLDREVDLVGIAKYKPDERAKEAISKGYKVFIPRSNEKEFKNKKLEFTGFIEDAIQESDIVIDASKEGLGYENKQTSHLPMKPTAISHAGAHS